MAETYYVNRGHFIETALTGWLPRYPVGAGLGRWGMPYVYFGRRLPTGVPGSELYAEENITAWVYQGGVVMLALMAGALTIAMFNMVRIARTTPDRDLALSASVITALCVGVLISAFGYVPFVAPSGLIFWLLAASLHAADQRVRADQEVGQGAVARTAVHSVTAVGETCGVGGGKRKILASRAEPFERPRQDRVRNGRARQLGPDHGAEDDRPIVERLLQGGHRPRSGGQPRVPHDIDQHVGVNEA